MKVNVRLWAGHYFVKSRGNLLHEINLISSLAMLYTMGTWSFPGEKRPGRVVDQPPARSAEVKERVELYLYSPSGPSRPVLGWTLPLQQNSLPVYQYFHTISVIRTVCSSCTFVLDFFCYTFRSHGPPFSNQKYSSINNNWLYRKTFDRYKFVVVE